MIKSLELKCPYCGSTKFAEIHQNPGISYVITEVNTNSNPPAFIANAGIPVKIYGCLDCGRLTFFNGDLDKGIS